jgi:hypothetical protein
MRDIVAQTRVYRPYLVSLAKVTTPFTPGSEWKAKVRIRVLILAALCAELLQSDFFLIVVGQFEVGIFAIGTYNVST